MVKVIQKENKELYQCPECGFHYDEKEWAEKFEAWCREHKSCPDFAPIISRVLDL